ncbi:cell division protein ZapC domain-containing protein [Paraglaciecola sp.]|uniref:cell division protein ZapC domain-containing protein n=1 Tax=Paraglaciecola sp. TaxID=1920173 RepID=UPI0030F3C042
MLQPKADWYWYCDGQHLMLSLGQNLQFKTAYLPNRLINTPINKQWFNLEDTGHYSNLAEQLEACPLNLSSAELTQILINGVAALAFHKPVTLRSWYFTEQTHFGSNHQLASLENDIGKGEVLILEQDHNVATCMVISKSLSLHSDKQLNQFELIKVMKNRLIPFVSHSILLSQSA